MGTDNGQLDDLVKSWPTLNGNWRIVSLLHLLLVGVTARRIDLGCSHHCVLSFLEYAAFDEVVDLGMQSISWQRATSDRYDSPSSLHIRRQTPFSL